ncbi:MAG: B12-binding domain-containing radical SAM protein [Deltaproteobacteria bacterium]|nr:B12-binding domain-containing radical SAM protein [Deltaproteobacteria bacterium]
MKFFFIYVDDIRDTVKCHLEKSPLDVSAVQIEQIMSNIKKIHGPKNPLGGNPRLGILTLAAILRQQFGDRMEIHYCDMAFDCLESEDLRKRLRDLKPDFVGLSAMLPFAHIFHEVTKVVKEEVPDCTLMAGGPYLSSAPSRAMEDPCLDVGVLFEAEETLPELMDTLLSQGDLKEVKGIVFRKDGEVTFTPARPMVADLNQVPWPAVDLINLDQYSKAYRIIHPPKKSMPLFSSRGCSYECTYCHNLSGKTVRWRSAESVFGEMSYYYEKHAVREFFFWDDIFNLNIKRAHKICELIIDSGMKIRFSFPRGMRGDILTRDLIDKMMEAGLCQSSFAVESASPRLQKMIKKYNNFGKMTDTIQYCVEKGMLVTTFNMVDFPTETEEEMLMTLDYNLSLPHHDVTLFKVSPFEGTQLYDQLGGYDHYENLGAATFYKYKKSIISGVSAEFLEKFIKDFGLKFYFSKARLKRALEFISPHISTEDVQEHFQTIYSVAKMHYGIEGADLEDGEARGMLENILNPPKPSFARQA